MIPIPAHQSCPLGQFPLDQSGACPILFQQRGEGCRCYLDHARPLPSSGISPLPLPGRLSVTDSAGFGAYQPLASAAVARYRGRYVLPHDTPIEALEGNWKPNRIVLIEFDDADQAKQWWSSPAYAEARTIHQEATISNIILVDGAPLPIRVSAAPPYSSRASSESRDPGETH